jgi:phosphatidylserine/phosphatidylglycerophosphate/cardiolipin synthase-like enzyme
MPSDLSAIAEAATDLAREVPAPLLDSLAELIRGCDPGRWSSSRTRMLSGVSHPHYRSLVAQFLDLWHERSPQLSPEAVALSLATAVHADQRHRDHQSVELAWTGPEAGQGAFRRTEQVILQVIGSATRRVLVASYAVFRIPRIGEALVRAADRGVSLTVILETPDRAEGRDAYDTLRALGPAVSARSQVYLWPHERRPRDETGRAGILHVKCVAADRRWLFLSSANLTEYAFTLNMELGFLVSGGVLPGQVEDHFDRLISHGVLAIA